MAGTAYRGYTYAAPRSVLARASCRGHKVQYLVFPTQTCVHPQVAKWAQHIRCALLLSAPPSPWRSGTDLHHVNGRSEPSAAEDNLCTKRWEQGEICAISLHPLKPVVACNREPLDPLLIYRSAGSQRGRLIPLPVCSRDLRLSDWNLDPSSS